MAEPRQSKRRPVFSGGGGGGGIEALVVWGGALAVAGLVAAFTVGKVRRVDEHGAKKKKQGQIDVINEPVMKETEDVRNKGLQSGIPEAPPFPRNTSEKFYETSKTDRAESVTTQNLEGTGERGENKNSAGGHQEMVLSDTEQESIAISDDYCVAEEFPSHSSSMNESENMNKEERKRSPKARPFDAGHATEGKVSAIESSSASSTDEEEEDEEDSHTQSTMSSTEEEDESSAIQSTLSDQEGKEDQDDETEGSGSGNSSAESKMEPIWPAEMVEVLSNKKDGNHYRQLSEEKYKKDAKGENAYLGRIGGAGNLKVIKNNNVTEYANVAYQSLPQMKRTIFIKSALSLMMFILIANIIWSLFAPEDSSVFP